MLNKSLRSGHVLNAVTLTVTLAAPGVASEHGRSHRQVLSECIDDNPGSNCVQSSRAIGHPPSA